MKPPVEMFAAKLIQRFGMGVVSSGLRRLLLACTAEVDWRPPVGMTGMHDTASDETGQGCNKAAR